MHNQIHNNTVRVRLQYMKMVEVSGQVFNLRYLRGKKDVRIHVTGKLKAKMRVVTGTAERRKGPARCMWLSTGTYR